MPTHAINTVDDALKLVDHYQLYAWLNQHACRARSFACWLFNRTRTVSTGDLAEYMRAHVNERGDDSAKAAQFDAEHEALAEDAMLGYRSYEKGVSDLMWLIRQARTEQAGREAWSVIAELAVVVDRAAVIASQNAETLRKVKALLQEVGAIDLSANASSYQPGADLASDGFMRLDIERLDETLADERLWKDDEELTLPDEIAALRQMANDALVLETIDAKLEGRLSKSARAHGEQALRH